MIPISESYAEALYNASEKLECTTLVADELLVMEELLDQCDVFLANPTIDTKMKADALRETLYGEVSDLTLEYILLMTLNRHLKHFSAAVGKFIKLSGRGGTVLSLRIPYAPEQDVIEKLKKSFSEKELIPGDTSAVEIKIIEDKELIGGFVASCNGYQIDTSLKTALSRLGRYGKVESITL